MSLALVVEGDTDLPIARKLARDASLHIFMEIDARGKGTIDAEINGYNDAAKGSPWFVLRDLDHDEPCGGAFLKALRFRPTKWMCFRLAVRELESWLIADEQAAAGFFGVDERWFPSRPDEETDPTLALVNLCRKSGKKRIRQGMVPGSGSVTAVGPL